MNTFETIVPKALDELRQGRPVILFDDIKRENEGDLIVVAEKITPETINFMTKIGRGLICLAMPESEIQRLQLPMMVPHNTSRYQTGFTISIEAASGVSTGISAHDRARTIQVAIDPNSKPDDLLKPGHIFPLRVTKNGVLARQGQTEGSSDLARLAGFSGSAVICEIMNDDGTMARMDDLKHVAEQHNLTIVSVRDVINYRLRHECLIEEVAASRLPVDLPAEFTLKVFANVVDHHHHLALVKGEIDTSKPVLVRMHSECLTGDLFGSARCDCGWQKQMAMQKIAEEGGLFLYLRQEGRGIGLENKIKAYALQDEGLDTIQANQKLGFEPDQRDYWMGAQILRYLGVSKVRLLTNNPRKLDDLQRFGIEVVQRESLIMPPSKENLRYLKAKQEKLGHLLELEDKLGEK